MSESKESGTRVTPSLSSSERHLWGRSPLSGRKDTGYGGDLFSEVWGDGFVCIAMSDPRIAGPALAALGGSSPVTSLNHDLPGAPVMMDRPGEEFLGRVVVEFWTGKTPVVGAFGSDIGRVIDFTEARLKTA